MLLLSLLQPRIIHFSKEHWFFLVECDFYEVWELGVLIAIEVLSTDILNRKELSLKLVISDGLYKGDLDKNIKI